MPLQLRCREIASLPKLAWLAVLDRDAGSVQLLHGAAVECRERWAVEGVWDGEFDAGGFHRSQHFFGSGVTVEGDRVYFVPSRALVDRLVYCVDGPALVVSNSLVLLLAFTGAQLDPAHDYHLESRAIRQGVKHYDRRFVVRHPEIPCFYQAYYASLVVSGGQIEVVSPPATPRLTSFAHYRELLTAALDRIRDNYSATTRRTPLRALATLSSGYDSPAVAALVKELGVELCFTSRRSNTHFPRWLSSRAAIDDGTPIADALGLRTAYLDRPGRAVTEDELYFLAPGCGQPALAFHSMATYLEATCQGAVVFTGFQGDYAWDVNVERKYLNEDLLGNDTSGLAFSEIRLKSGFINVAVPYMFAERVADLVAIGESPDMRAYRLHTGYDRPIPRRLAEEAGVPRGAFGARKKAVVQAYDYPVNRRLRTAFFRFVRTETGHAPWFIYLHSAVNRTAFLAVRAARKLQLTRTPVSDPTPRVLLGKRFDFPQLMFRWAAQVLSDRAAGLLAKQGGALTLTTVPRPQPPIVLPAAPRAARRP